jgi:hypothetical protein
MPNNSKEKPHPKLARQNVGKVVKAAGYTKAGRYVGMGYQSPGYVISSARDYSGWSKGLRGNDMPFKDITVGLVGGVPNVAEEIEKVAKVLETHWNVRIIDPAKRFAKIRLTEKDVS